MGAAALQCEKMCAVTTDAPAAPVKHLPRLITVWLFAVVCSVLVAVFAAESSRFEWFALTIGASALLAFGMQLGTALRDGFITRTALSVAGAVLIVGITVGVTALGS